MHLCFPDRDAEDYVPSKRAKLRIDKLDSLYPSVDEPVVKQSTNANTYALTAPYKNPTAVQSVHPSRYRHTHCPLFVYILAVSILILVHSSILNFYC